MNGPAAASGTNEIVTAERIMNENLSPRKTRKNTEEIKSKVYFVLEENDLILLSYFPFIPCFPWLTICLNSLK